MCRPLMQRRGAAYRKRGIVYEAMGETYSSQTDFNKADKLEILSFARSGRSK